MTNMLLLIWLIQKNKKYNRWLRHMWAILKCVAGIIWAQTPPLPFSIQYVPSPGLSTDLLRHNTGWAPLDGSRGRLTSWTLFLEKTSGNWSSRTSVSVWKKQAHVSGNGPAEREITVNQDLQVCRHEVSEKQISSVGQRRLLFPKQQKTNKKNNRKTIHCFR